MTTITRLDLKTAMADYRLMNFRREIYRSLSAVAACVKSQPFDSNFNDEYTSDTVSGIDEPVNLTLGTLAGSTTDTLGTSGSSCSALRASSDCENSQTSSNDTLAQSLSLASELGFDAQGGRASTTADRRPVFHKSKPSSSLPVLCLASIRENLRAFQVCRSVFYERMALLCGSHHASNIKASSDRGSAWVTRLFYGLFGCNDVVVANRLTLSMGHTQMLVKSEEISLRAALKLDQTFGKGVAMSSFWVQRFVFGSRIGGP